MRRELDLYPDLSAFLQKIRENGVSPDLLRRILERHRGNARHTRELYDRYCGLDSAIPIFSRAPRFPEGMNAINNHMNHDFFGEIIDFKVGYFAGKPIVYSYSGTEESFDDTGGEEAVEAAQKALSDFVTRNNLYDVDMEITKFASICGYSGRLFYIDPDGAERVMAVPPYETVLLYASDMTEPEFAVRYYTTLTADGTEKLNLEFYDAQSVVFYAGNNASDLREIQRRPHLFDFCPLQGIPNNRELTGDAEKVLSLIDDYDRVVSDNSNELEGFAHAYMEFRNVNIHDEEYERAAHTGAFEYDTADNPDARIGFITKEVNDTYNQNHLERVRDNIYKFSKTPNLSDESFGAASGISLKFKLHGLETKCGAFQAKMQSAGVYMFKLLASSWRKKQIAFDPLQCFMTFKRNFPLDVVSEAQAVQTLIAAGLPKRVAFECLSWLDDLDYVMSLIEEETAGIPPLSDGGEPEENPDEP